MTLLDSRDWLTKLVQDAYEEGVEDGIDWQRSPCGEPQPQWIDTCARMETAKALRTRSTQEGDKG